ncbi:MAG TPA: CBO0543 family protein [Desulfosporosinus sp.]|nr:CBO0543 family protein [Desulfosporosinus sp.]
MNFNTVVEQSNILYLRFHETILKFNDLWYNHILFTWRWWLSVFLIVLPWIIWHFYRNKESSDRLLSAGLFVIIISSFLNITGISMNLWGNPVRPLPIVLPYDASALPVATMLTIQFFPKVNPLIKSILFSAFVSFILMPIGSSFSLYINIAWKDYYSFPIFIVIYLLANRIASVNEFIKNN